MIKKVNFTDFSQIYTGLNNRDEIVNELKDALIIVNFYLTGLVNI